MTTTFILLIINTLKELTIIIVKIETDCKKSYRCENMLKNLLLKILHIHLQRFLELRRQ